MSLKMTALLNKVPVWPRVIEIGVQDTKIAKMGVLVIAAVLRWRTTEADVMRLCMIDATITSITHTKTRGKIDSAMHNIGLLDRIWTRRGMELVTPAAIAIAISAAFAPCLPTTSSDKCSWSSGYPQSALLVNSLGLCFVSL